MHFAVVSIKLLYKCANFFMPKYAREAVGGRFSVFGIYVIKI